MKTSVIFFIPHDDTTVHLLDYFESKKRCNLVGSIESLTELNSLIAIAIPDIIVIDEEFINEKNLKFLIDFKWMHSKVHVLVLFKDISQKEIINLLKKEINGFLRKDCNHSVLWKAIKSTSKNGFYLCIDVEKMILNFFRQNTNNLNSIYQLTQRENEVFELLNKGYSTKYIAYELNIS